MKSILALLLITYLISIQGYLWFSFVPNWLLNTNVLYNPYYCGVSYYRLFSNNRNLSEFVLDELEHECVSSDPLSMEFYPIDEDSDSSLSSLRSQSLSQPLSHLRNEFINQNIINVADTPAYSNSLG